MTLRIATGVSSLILFALYFSGFFPQTESWLFSDPPTWWQLGITTILGFLMFVSVIASTALVWVSFFGDAFSAKLKWTLYGVSIALAFIWSAPILGGVTLSVEMLLSVFILVGLLSPLVAGVMYAFLPKWFERPALSN